MTVTVVAAVALVSFTDLPWHCPAERPAAVCFCSPLSALNLWCCYCSAVKLLRYTLAHQANLLRVVFHSVIAIVHQNPAFILLLLLKVGNTGYRDAGTGGF